MINCPNCMEIGEITNITSKNRMKNIWVKQKAIKEKNELYELFTAYECPKCQDFIAIEEELK